MWPNPQETADLVTFTEEFLNGKLHFLHCKNKKFTERLPKKSILSDQTGLPYIN